MLQFIGDDCVDAVMEEKRLSSTKIKLSDGDDAQTRTTHTDLSRLLSPKCLIKLTRY
jgi:hypothetical protein